MKPPVLQARPLPDHVETALGKTYELHRLHQMDDPSGWLAANGSGIRAIATGGWADRALIDALPDLEIISSFGVGYDGVDAAHAAACGIAVTNTPDVLNDDVANMAILLLLATTRRFTEWHDYARENLWQAEGPPPLARSVRGRRCGILGLGRIGRDIAAKLAVFGVEVVYSGRKRQQDQPFTYYDDLVAMARDSDFLIAICPGGDETRGIVNAGVLSALGPQGVFINIARGSVHDEPALIAALEKGELGAAGLDVFADEPEIPAPLRQMPNVVLQPHQGSATVETRKAMGDLVVANLAAHFAGRPLISPVTDS